MSEKLKSDSPETLMSIFREEFSCMGLTEIHNKFPDFYNDIAVQHLSNLASDLIGLDVGTVEYCDQVDRIQDIITLMNEAERASPFDAIHKKPLSAEEAAQIVLKQQAEEPHDERND